MKSKEQAILDEMVREYEAKVSNLEHAMVQYALKHDLRLNLGDYGTGRTLIVSENHWSGKERGEWVYSSENC